MKTKHLVLLSAGLLILSGCASMNSPTAEVPGSPHYDQRYIGAVNNVAHKTGTRVIWVNPPRAMGREKSGG